MTLNTIYIVRSHMLIKKPLMFIENYINSLDLAIQTYCPESKLTRLQKYWIAFCITAILVTNSVCWAQFQRARSTLKHIPVLIKKLEFGAAKKYR